MMECHVWPGKIVVSRDPTAKGPSKANFVGGSSQLETLVQYLHTNFWGASIPLPGNTPPSKAGV